MSWCARSDQLLNFSNFSRNSALTFSHQPKKYRRNYNQFIRLSIKYFCKMVRMQDKLSATSTYTSCQKLILRQRVVQKGKTIQKEVWRTWLLKHKNIDTSLNQLKSDILSNVQYSQKFEPELFIDAIRYKKTTPFQSKKRINRHLRVKDTQNIGLLSVRICQTSYHIGSLYRQLKCPIYEKLLLLKKQGKGEALPDIKKSVEELIELLYKYCSLNSKYRHREKMRFERTPLLKYLQFNFAKLNHQLKNKEYMQVYDDLDDEDDEDQGPVKKQYQKDNSFNEQTLLNYKRKNGINNKIIAAINYEDLKQALTDQYAWNINQQANSLFYDCKFVSKKKDIDYVNLLDCQYVNHFQENKAITAKFGLARNIRNLASLGRDPSVFFPRCYDLNDVAELEDFYEDFKYSYIRGILAQFMEAKGSIHKNKIKPMKLALQLLSREMQPIEKRVELIKSGKRVFISFQEWKLLQTWKDTQQSSQYFVEEELLKEANIIHKQYKDRDPQWSLNRDNIWIVKPASMSRGRGIKTFDDLNDIFQYVVGCQISWVAQKYIERPLIIKKKKFDIRQWVLWTDFKPLKAWMYDQCYFRFCSEIYTPQNLKNRKIHLTNNSVTKGVNAQLDGIEQNMMNEETFSAQIKLLYGQQFNSTIKPQMRKIVIQSLQSVVQNVVYRKNSFEMLGYDFMIDEDLKVWLIEVNSSPCMEYSTEVTAKLVPQGLSDLASVIENYITKGKQYRYDKANQLYGRWKLLPIH